MGIQDGLVRFNQPLRPPLRRVARARAEGEPAWPSFRGQARLAGASTKGVSVYVDEAFGAEATQNADDLLAATDRVVAQNNAIFGIDGAPVDVVVCALRGPTDGTGGTDHDGCDFRTGSAIEVDAAVGNSNRVIALFEAELSGRSGRCWHACRTVRATDRQIDRRGMEQLQPSGRRTARRCHQR